MQEETAKKNSKEITSNFYELSGGSAKNRPFEKIDFLWSTSYVVFLKANVKISYKPKFQKIRTLPYWLAYYQSKGFVHI